MTTRTADSTHPTTSKRPDVRLAPPPPALMKLFNPFVRRVLTSRSLGARMGRKSLLEFDGRRSGRRYRIPVCVHRVDGVATMFTERPWRHNLAGGARVTVWNGGRPRTGRAALINATPEQLGAAMRGALDDGASAFELGLKVRRGCHPTASDLSQIQRWIIRLDFDEETS